MCKRIDYFATLTLILLSYPLTATQIEFRNIEQQSEMTDANIRAGNLSIDLGYTLGVVYDDNTNRSGNEQRTADNEASEEGTKIANGLNIRLDWPLSPYLRLGTNGTVSYVFFASGEGTDGLIISGSGGQVSSDIVFDIRVGQYGLVTLQNEFARSVDTIEVFREATGDFSIWSNRVSLQYQNQFSPFMTGALELSRYDEWADKDEFNFKDKNEYVADLLLLWDINSYTQAGPFVRYTTTEFEEEQTNDVDEVEVGLTINYNLSETIQTNFKIGYQFVDIDTSNVATSTDEEDGVTGAAGISHQVTDLIQQNVQFTYRRTLGISQAVNFSEDTTTIYGVNWDFAQNWSFYGSFTWLHANESDTGEVGDTYTSAAGVRYDVSQQVGLSLGYRYTDKQSDSNAADSEYDRNEVTFNLNYDF